MEKIKLREELLEYAGTLEIEHIGRRCVRIKYLGGHKKYKLYEMLHKYVYGKHFNPHIISSFNSDGTWTYAELRLLPQQEPFNE